MKVRQFVLLAAAMLACEWSQAAEITVVSTVAVQGVLERVRQSFEHSSGNHLNIRYGSSAALKRQLDDGDSFDVAILTQPLIDDLAKHGKVVGATASAFAKTGIGVAVKAGTAKPGIGTRNALRSALLASRGVAYPKDGQSGVSAQHVFDVLRITNEIKDRIYVDPRAAGGLLAVAEGKATMAFAAVSEIAANSQVDLVGPLPGDLQTYVAFSVGTAAGTKEPEACRSFSAFLRTPAVRRELRNMGLVSE
jgi:molybdate transport system substrate-binding protein